MSRSICGLRGSDKPRRRTWWAKSPYSVLTDELPPQILETDRMRWWAFGIPQPNVALVNATRTATDLGERCLLEITNLSPHTGSTELIVAVDDAASQSSASLLRRSTLEIGRERRAGFS